MTDFGTDVNAVTGWPDPETLASGLQNVGNALARRLLEEPGAQTDVGITDPYACINLRDYLGARLTSDEVDQLQTLVVQILEQEERVSSVTARVSFLAGALSVSVQGTTSDGPFSFILSIDAVGVATISVP